MAAARGASINDASRTTHKQPRVPSRGRGVARHAALLDATETLLRDRSPDDVGIYQIAEAAGIPPASAYHFFPTKEAAFVALVRRYMEGFTAASREPFAADRLRSWQDLMRIEQECARTYYGTHPAALKLLYGGFGGYEGRRLDHEFISAMAEGMYRRYDTVFHMPHMVEPATNFHVALSIMEAVWSLSYRQTGEITDGYAEEGYAACVAYCRLFLPERVPARDWVRALALSGASITLPLE